MERRYPPVLIMMIFFFQRKYWLLENCHHTSIDYLNEGMGRPWASHKSASLIDDFVRRISDLPRGGRRGETLVIGSNRMVYKINRHTDDIDPTTAAPLNKINDPFDLVVYLTIGLGKPWA